MHPGFRLGRFSVRFGHFPGRYVAAHSDLLYEAGGWILRLKPPARGPLRYTMCRIRQCLQIN